MKLSQLLSTRCYTHSLLQFLMLCMPGKKFQQTTFWNICLIFPRTEALTFQANCLFRRQFAWNVKAYFLGKKNKKNIINLLTAELVQRVVTDNKYNDTQCGKDGLKAYFDRKGPDQPSHSQSNQTYQCPLSDSMDTVQYINKERRPWSDCKDV